MRTRFCSQRLAQNPNCVVAPAARVLFQSTPLAVIWLPVCDKVAFQ